MYGLDQEDLERRFVVADGNGRKIARDLGIPEHRIFEALTRWNIRSRFPLPCPDCGEPRPPLRKVCPPCKKKRAAKKTAAWHKARRDKKIAAGAPTFQCRICGEDFLSIVMHLNAHEGWTTDRYRDEYPGAPFHPRPTEKRKEELREARQANAKYKTYPHKPDRAFLGVVCGSMLGDATLVAPKNEHYNSAFRREGANYEYLVWLEDYCKRRVPTSLRETSHGGKAYHVVSTGVHPLFTNLERIWYDHSRKKRRKIVPVDYVRKRLTPLGFAVWIADDGTRPGPDRLNLCAHGFTMDERLALAAILNEKWDLDAEAHESGLIRIGSAGVLKAMKVTAGTELPGMRYKFIDSLGHASYGENHWNAKVSDEQVLEIIAHPERAEQFADVLGVSPSSIQAYLRGQRRSRVTGKTPVYAVCEDCGKSFRSFAEKACATPECRRKRVNQAATEGRSRELAESGHELVECLACKTAGGEYRRRSLSQHLRRQHGIGNAEEYRAQFGKDALVDAPDVTARKAQQAVAMSPLGTEAQWGSRQCGRQRAPKQ